MNVKTIVYFPAPININMMWNFGSILGVFLMLQIVTGLFLSMHYTPHVMEAFNSIVVIMHDVNYGWCMRLMHMNGASFFFFFLFLHIGRGLYFGSYMFKYTWLSGGVIFILSMAVAFLGYVLPWGQMSFWGVTVITNLVSAFPYVGSDVVFWLWGGFSINNATLNRFYTFHFILPFFVLLMVFIHLMFLHITGSNNPVGVSSNLYKIPFHIYFTIKDIEVLLVIISSFMMMCFLGPYILGDPENFIMANSMLTPIHIQPEWYFLFAYAILRAIPNKLGGVIALLLSVMIILIMPFYNYNLMQSMGFYPLNQYVYWVYINVMLLLTWVGMQPIDYPFVLISQILSLIYFMYYILMPLFFKYWDEILS
uniref:Cytochrome b n=1 Tax=Pujadella villari TaxID=2943468 RepID=A0A9E8G7A3_9HYME|nr:cytochrome b [Pujadella villari]